MQFELSKFTILGLHGDMNVNIELKNNKLVIVAENGIGKTTIVNIIYNTLSRQWYKLTEYNFDKIIFVLNGKEYAIQRDELNEYIKLRKLRSRSIRRGQSLRISNLADHILQNYNIQNLLNNTIELQNLAQRFEVPTTIIFDLCNELLFTTKGDLIRDNLEIITDVLNRELKAQILYLPTYRRIEKDLKNIFPDLETNLDSLRNRRVNTDEENSSKYIELVESGMDDVQLKVDQKLDSLYVNFTNNLRQSLMGGYLKDILNKNYELYNYKFIQDITTEKLNEILNRIDNSILQKKEKESLKEFVENYTSSSSIKNEDKIIAYFIQKLVEIYDKQSIEEKDVISFVNICNDYCRNKDFIYSREERKIKIFLKEQEKEINFSKLSSGEKQIVSLFSHLYLSTYKNFFVIIDEPELSLSVSWQERLLSDIMNAYNTGLIAVTHSPFIFTNDLESHTKGLNEFISIK